MILQGHLDMVCEKEPDCDIDMSVQSIKACTDGKTVWTDGTTLGTDDGIAVAFILAVLASDTIAHPPIQAVLTSDEEIGMPGARDLDTSDLTAKRLINIDSETEGILYVSCAGGVRAECDIPVAYEDAAGWVADGEQDNDMSGDASDNAGSLQNGSACFEVKISGLAGRHSGVEIHKQHTNAIRLLASLLSHASDAADFRLVSLSGGGKENAIPKEAKAVVSVRSCYATTFEQSIKDSAAVWMQEISASEPHTKIEVEKTHIAADKVLDSKSTANVIYALQLSPDGVYKYLIRSNTAAGKKLLLERVTTFVKHLSGKVVTMSDVMDSICATLYVMFLLWAIGDHEKFNKWTKADTSVIDGVGAALEEEAKANTKPLVWQNIIILLGAGLLVSAVSMELGNMINAHLSFFDSATWTVLIVSVLGILFALTPFGKIKGTEEISNVMLYIVIALIASRADLGAVGNAPIWLLAGFVILLIHVAIMIALAKILKLDIFTCCVASLANIGGTATAPVLAGAYSNALVPVGIMMALLGYVIGTGGGLVVANLMSIFG